MRKRFDIVLAGVLTGLCTAGTLAGLALMVSLNRCAGFFGETGWEDGTLSVPLCNAGWGVALLWGSTAAPIAGALWETVAAWRRGDRWRPGPAFLVAVGACLGVLLLFIVSTRIG